MALRSMILSRDSKEICVFECILAGLHMDVEVEAEPQIAWDRLAKSKIDAFIVDYDLVGRDGFIRYSQDVGVQDFGPVVIASGTGIIGLPELSETKFLVEKPVPVERAVHVLSAARNYILQGRLRYHRQTLDVPVSVTGTSALPIGAHLLNLSQGGVRIHLQQPQNLEGTVQVNFTLPEAKWRLEARGEVAWADQQGNAGIRLIGMSESLQKKLRLWLERQYLLNSENSFSTLLAANFAG